MGNLEGIKIDQKQVHPLWPICRILAHKTRLRLLGELFKSHRHCVFELAKIVGTTEQNVSLQLRSLHTVGLILPCRRKQKVFYAAEPTSRVPYAESLLPALRQCFEEAMPIATMIRQATAFTHSRRMDVVRALSGCSLSSVELAEKTGMTSSALARHLDKLEARKIVQKAGHDYSLGVPENSLGKALLEAALRL